MGSYTYLVLAPRLSSRKRLAALAEKQDILPCASTLTTHMVLLMYRASQGNPERPCLIWSVQWLFQRSERRCRLQTSLLHCYHRAWCELHNHSQQLDMVLCAPIDSFLYHIRLPHHSFWLPYRYTPSTRLWAAIAN